jgi:peptide/nickel transport system substrate-binding protein
MARPTLSTCATTWCGHDGAPFNADDVTYTVSVLQSPDFPGSPYLADMWRSVTLDKLDDYTLTVTLREPFAPFLDYTTVGILPAHILSTVPVSELANSQFNAAPDRHRAVHGQ